MKRLLLIALCSGLAWAQPNVQITDTVCTAPGDVSHPVKIMVTVENKGKDPSQGGILTVICTPQIPGQKNNKGVAGMADPLPMNQPIPVLNPGQKQTVTFDTPYESTSSFRAQRGSFRASNITPADPSVTVKVQSTLK